MGIFLPKLLTPEWEEKIVKAMAQALETDNFSDDWVRAAARDQCEELLKNARQIEHAEAERRVKVKQREANYKKIAAWAKKEHGHNPKYIVEVLRKADELPYRLLQEAK